jgi:cytidylate kinase
MALDQVDAQKAEQVMRRMDKKRASYHNYYSENKWGVCSSCDLSISTSTFGIDGTVQAILAVLNQLK